MKHRCGLRCSRRQSTMRLLVVSVCFWQAVVIAEPLQEFKQQVAAERQGLGTPSVSIAIIDKSTPRYLNFGLSHSEKSDLVTSDTLYELASISKPKTARATMRLAQLGLVSLDAPISPYIEPLILPISGYQNNKVTLRRIMSHTAGLSVRSYQGFPAGQKLPTIEDSLNGIPLLQWWVYTCPTCNWDDSYNSALLVETYLGDKCLTPRLSIFHQKFGCLPLH
ncbi:MAG: CubicO group peptidase (beta-lactamase class C family) [Candidatus Azotimanducaceae bacterium]|jgi:CubicO group peptidase (beta-lactamase class C family)